MVIFLLIALGIISSKVSIFKQTFLEISSPFQCAITFSIGKLKSIWNNYIYLVNIREKHTNLLERIKDLESKENDLIETRLENERLRGLLNSKKRTPVPMVLARVIAEDVSSWFKTILIDKGSKEGIKRRMAVVIPEGIVGQIIETSKTTSRVLLIIDNNSAIDTRVQRTRAKGILQGRGENICYLKYFSLSADIEIGDKIVSSGLGGVFPQGLLVGEIFLIEKKKAGLFQYVEVIPSVNFAKLEEMFVVLTPQPVYKIKISE